MNKPLVLLLKTAAWSVIIAFLGASVLVHRWIAEALQPGRVLWCGNTVTDPLGLALSAGSPAAFAAVAVLAVLWRRDSVIGSSLILAAAVALTCTAWLLGTGVRFFRDCLPGHPFSECIWWLQPIGGWFGI